VLELAIETVELSEGPLRLKIWGSIQDRIVSADWPPLFQLPSEPELAHQFNVGRMIVRQSIQTLLEKGFLYRLSWGVQCIEARIPDSEGKAVLECRRCPHRSLFGGGPSWMMKLRRTQRNRLSERQANLRHNPTKVARKMFTGASRWMSQPEKKEGRAVE